MTVTLDLKPEVEERIAAEAKARGLSVETYTRNVLEKDAANVETSFALRLRKSGKRHSLNGSILRGLNTHHYQMKR